jgi:hypothetical protein
MNPSCTSAASVSSANQRLDRLALAMLGLEECRPDAGGHAVQERSKRKGDHRRADRSAEDQDERFVALVQDAHVDAAQERRQKDAPEGDNDPDDRRNIHSGPFR